MVLISIFFFEGACRQKPQTENATKSLSCKSKFKLKIDQRCDSKYSMWKVYFTEVIHLGKAIV